MREIKVDKEFVELLGKVKNHKYIVRSRIWEPKEEGFGRVYFFNEDCIEGAKKGLRITP